MMLHLVGLKHIPHLVDQFSNALRSFCRVAWSSSVLISLYTRQSSAKSHVVVPGVTCGKSFMKSRNNNGPRTVPCGTPDMTCAFGEESPSMITHI